MGNGAQNSKDVEEGDRARHILQAGGTQSANCGCHKGNEERTTTANGHQAGRDKTRSYCNHVDVNSCSVKRGIDDDCARSIE